MRDEVAAEGNVDPAKHSPDKTHQLRCSFEKLLIVADDKALLQFYEA